MGTLLQAGLKITSSQENVIQREKTRKGFLNKKGKECSQEKKN